MAPNPALLTNNKLLLVDRQTINRTTVGSPNDKFSLATDYTAGCWGGHAVATRNGINPYSGFAPNGFNGRYYYAKANSVW